MAQHELGKMDISEQEKTFAGYVKFATWAIVVIVALLIFLAIVGG